VRFSDDERSFEAFRGLVPDHPRISIQQRGWRRFGLAAGVLVGGATLVVVVIQNLRGVNLL